jgi:hypothetical protein
MLTLKFTVNLCYVMGQFIQTGVTRAFINRLEFVLPGVIPFLF